MQKCEVGTLTCNRQYKGIFLPLHLPLADTGGRRKISRTPLTGTRILFYGRVPNSFPPLRGTNSTTTNYMTGTANLNSNKDNFRTLSAQGLFESIVINHFVLINGITLSGSSPFRF